MFHEHVHRMMIILDISICSREYEEGGRSNGKDAAPGILSKSSTGAAGDNHPITIFNSYRGCAQHCKDPGRNSFSGPWVGFRGFLEPSD